MRPKALNAVDDLAVFGAAPLFDRVRPIGQLSMPDVEEYLALVRGAYDTRVLTNNGPLVVELEERLARYHGTKHCVSVANAGLGLIMLGHIFAAGRRGEVIMPGFSYRGLPHLVQWSAQMPRFCDVDPTTHTLDPASLRAAITSDTTLILAVCNFNSPGDIDGICAIADEHQLPVIFDSVDALGATYHGRRLGSFGRAEVFSTHATKMLNGFEGGYITTDDDELAELLRWQRDGAAPERRPRGAAMDSLVGLGAQFNEIYAAMALLSLAQIDRIIAANRERAMAYKIACAGLPGLSLLPYGDEHGETSNYRMVVAAIGPQWPLTRDETIVVLRAEGAAIDAHWSPALHLSVHAPLGIATRTLPVAQALGERMMHLPVGDLVSLDDIAQIGRLLHFIAASGSDIASRLRAGSAP